MYRIKEPAPSMASKKFSQAWETQINLNDISEVLEWTRRLGCSDSRLREATRVVGLNAADVRRYLGR